MGGAAGLAHTQLPALRIACLAGVSRSWLGVNLKWTGLNEVTCSIAGNLASLRVAVAAYLPPHMFLLHTPSSR